MTDPDLAQLTIEQRVRKLEAALAHSDAQRIAATVQARRYRSFVSWLDGMCVDFGDNPLLVEFIRPAIARLNADLAAPTPTPNDGGT